MCVYRDRAPDSSGGDPQLVAAGSATSQEITNVLEHLRVGAPACPAPGSTYAVLGQPRGEVVYVAVDGCRGRALWDSGTGTLDAMGLQLLDRLIERTE